MSGFPAPPSSAAVAEFRDRGEEIVSKTLELSDFYRGLEGEDAGIVASKMRKGLEMTHRVVASVAQVPGPALLQDQVSWATTRLPHEGFTPAMVAANLATFNDAIGRTLTAEHAAEIEPIIEWLIDQITTAPSEGMG